MHSTDNQTKTSFNETEQPLISVVVLVFTTKKDVLQIALTMRDEYPCIGKWSIPGTYLRINETAEEAAYRCLSEKAGMKNFTIEQLYTFTDVNRIPDNRTIAISYIAIVPETNFTYQEGILSGKAAVFDIIRDNGSFHLTTETPEGPLRLEEDELAADHALMIRTALIRMKRIIDTARIGFRFLPDPSCFTLTDLRHIYDAIKGTKADIGNFRRFVKTRYIDSGEVVANNIERRTLNHAGRPASTFRYTGF